MLAHPSVPPVAASTNEPLPPIDEFEAPNSLGVEERQVWLIQAPHAFQARTLIRATALAFERYCRLVVMERDEAKSSGKGGPNHRGMLAELNKLELQFVLTPNGRALVAPPAASSEPQSALARFRNA